MGGVGHLRLRMLAVCDKTNLPFKDLDNLWVNLEKKICNRVFQTEIKNQF